MITAFRQQNGSLKPLRHAQAQRREMVPLNPSAHKLPSSSDQAHPAEGLPVTAMTLNNDNYRRRDCTGARDQTNKSHLGGLTISRKKDTRVILRTMDLMPSKGLVQ